MVDEEFSSISPYSDEEAVAALRRLSRHPMLPLISKYLFPKQPAGMISEGLRKVKSIDDFQQTVMSKVVSSVVETTSSGYSYEGIENLAGQKKYLAVSNHRDIILDPALTQWTLFNEGLPMTEICVGSNLLSSRTFEDLLRSNRMIKVIRGISARELYLSSKLLSRYIRHTITSDTASVWIAQREGRTKNGLDISEQGILKMFDLSGTQDFTNNFKELNIVPMSISYEYEPCDARKACELLIKRQSGTYTKKKNEDMHSILTGIRQWKGGIHLTVGKPLTEEELVRASWYEKNDRYQAIRRILDSRIIAGYKLWKTNYMGYDLMTGTSRFASMYSASDLAAFKSYTEHKLSKLDRRLDRNALRDIFWHIYGNPVVAKDQEAG